MGERIIAVFGPGALRRCPGRPAWFCVFVDFLVFNNPTAIVAPPAKKEHQEPKKRLHILAMASHHFAWSFVANLSRIQAMPNLEPACFSKQIPFPKLACSLLHFQVVLANCGIEPWFRGRRNGEALHVSRPCIRWKVWVYRGRNLHRCKTGSC
jgi:hypothetical protein